MRNILFIVFALSMAINGISQTMSWIPSKYSADKGCMDLTDCTTNTVCYKLQYTPAHSGELTSYTSGFWVNCTNKVSAVNDNNSCSMNDKSEELLLCDKESMILLYCSGNTGNLQVTAGKPIYLHQICLESTGRGDQVTIQKDDLVNISTSISANDGIPYTEYPTYKAFRPMNTVLFCDKADDNLQLEATLDEGGVVDFVWTPAKESEDGKYTLYAQQNDGEYKAVYTTLGKMLSQQEASDYKYTTDLLLSDQGEYNFVVEYTDANNDVVESNVVAVYYKDLNFTFSLAPNPTQDFIHIKVTADEPSVQLIVYNSAAQLVMKQDVSTDKEESIDLSSLVPGIYTVAVKSNDDILTEKLIVID